jgi:hypothetical protein
METEGKEKKTRRWEKKEEERKKGTRKSHWPVANLTTCSLHA